MQAADHAAPPRKNGRKPYENSAHPAYFRRRSSAGGAAREAELPDMVLPLRSGLPRGSNTRAETRHDDDDGNLHHSLQGDGVEVSLHPSADLVQVRLDLLQLEADEHIERGQQTE